MVFFIFKLWLVEITLNQVSCNLYLKTQIPNNHNWSSGIYVIFLLSYQDSNLDRQIQKLQCYHYTIRQKFVFGGQKYKKYSLYQYFFEKKGWNSVLRISTVFDFICCLTKTRTWSGRTKNCSATITPWDNHYVLLFKSGAKIRLFFVFAKLFCNFITIIYANNVYCVDYSAIIK